MKNSAQKFFLIVFGILVFLIMDQSLRLCLNNNTILSEVQKIIEAHEKFFWKTKSNLDVLFFKSHVVTDALGFRNLPDTSDSHLRSDILILGASPSFGWNMENNKTYPVLLQNNMRMFFPGFKIYNASVVGYSSFQGKRILAHYWSEKIPKIVVLAFGINDVDLLRFFYSNGKADKDTSAEQSIISDILERSGTSKLIQKVVVTNQLARCHSAIARVSGDDYVKNIEEMVAHVRKIGSVPLILLLPILGFDKINVSGESMDCYRYLYLRLQNYYLKLVKNLKSELVLSLTDELNRPELFLYEEKDYIHFSEKGHQLIAKKIEAFLLHNKQNFFRNTEKMFNLKSMSQ